MKLYQILAAKLSGKPVAPKEVNIPENQIYNPIGARIGSSITIDSIDCYGKHFFVTEIRDNCTKVAGQEFKMSDYTLTAKPLDGKDITVRLRVAEDKCWSLPSSTCGVPYKAMVLEQHDSLAYDEGLHNVLKETDDTGKFQIDHDGADSDIFPRCGGVKGSYKSHLVIVGRETLAGNADKFPTPLTGTTDIEYWDFSRIVKQDGVDVEQYLFVEMNTDNGWFELWKGCEIDPQKVDAI